jgi:hypothetical protein
MIFIYLYIDQIWQFYVYKTIFINFIENIRILLNNIHVKVVFIHRKDYKKWFLKVLINNNKKVLLALYAVKKNYITQVTVSLYVSSIIPPLFF